MILRVPILSQDDQCFLRKKETHAMINRFNDFIAASNGKGTTGHKIVLHVNDEQDRMRKYLEGDHNSHVVHALRWIMIKLDSRIKKGN